MTYIHINRRPLDIKYRFNEEKFHNFIGNSMVYKGSRFSATFGDIRQNPKNLITFCYK